MAKFEDLDYSKMRKFELQELLDERSISYKQKDSNDKLIDLLKGGG